MKTVIDSLFSNIEELERFLQSNKEISLASFTNANLRKNLLLASASYFETYIQNIITSFAENKSSNCTSLTAFVRNKAIKRQFHTYFDWDRSNANSFLGLFGEQFRDHFKALIEQDDKLKTSVSAFMEIGRERNRLVHQDFGNYSLEKTTQELFDLHKTAEKFVVLLKSKLENAT